MKPNMNPKGSDLYCLVIGNYGNYNIGDEMLLKEVIKEVSNGSQVRFNFYIPTRHEDFVKIYHEELVGRVTPIYLKDFKKLITAVLNCKIIVVGGGGIWSGDTGLLAHFVPFLSIAGKLCLKKVIFKSIGLYSTASSMDRFFVNLSIAFADMCSVRDNESYQMLWQINRNKKATRTDDLSLPYITYLDKTPETFSPDVMEYEKVRLLRDQGKLIVGISLKAMKDPLLNKRILGEFSNAINTLTDRYKHRIHFLFFPFAKTPPKSDEDFIQSLISNLRHKDNTTIVNHTNPVAWYRAIKELTDLFIGMRYHSIIFSFKAGKPVLALPYENKVVEFLKDYNRTNCRTVFPAQITESHIMDFIHEHAFVSK
jgi:polysaccharide pyruvyl transferase WcaK-like protein